MARVVVHPYDPSWPTQAAALAIRLGQLVPDALAVEHIGSTSIPGMAAKDCLDIMIVVTDLTTTAAATSLPQAGYPRRPEPWNQAEPAAGRSWPKMVFAPPVGERSVNVHVRLATAPTTRRALLFRDFLTHHPDRASTWADLKQAAARAADDLSQYGAIKDPAWLLLMDLAEQWAEHTGWQPPWPDTPASRPSRSSATATWPASAATCTTSAPAR